jgi:hypothetical protein
MVKKEKKETKGKTKEKKEKPEKKDRGFNIAPIDSFFNNEVEGIELAHNQLRFIHKTGDIKASGDQLEISMRSFFKGKLPEKYYISNGHIIDINLHISPQYDIIIADNFKSPILYKTFNDTEYLTYESIYAIGEIKSSWDKKHLKELIVNTERIKKFLKRSNVSPNFIDIGGKGIELGTETTKNPYKNPLFNFLFCASSDNFLEKDIKDLFLKTDWKHLPNIVCLFDKGLIVNINKEKLTKNNEFKINLYPEFISEEEKDQNKWVLLLFDKKSSSLGALYYLLIEHLNTCVLKYPDMLLYMQKMFEIKIENIDFIEEY